MKRHESDCDIKFKDAMYTLFLEKVINWGIKEALKVFSGDNFIKVAYCPVVVNMVF